MKIGIIGAGQIGGTLTRHFTALGHEVLVANSRGPETLGDLTAETGATAVSVREAVRGVDLVVVTISEKSIPSLPAELFADTDERVVVVDTGNYYPRQRDGRVAAIEAGTPESRWVEQQLGRPVVKAFNNIFAQHLLELGRPAGTTGALPSQLRATTPQPKRSCCGWLTNSASTGLMPVGWTSPGGNSPAPQSTRRISTPRASGARCRKRAGTARRSGAPPPPALVASPLPLDARNCSLSLWAVRPQRLARMRWAVPKGCGGRLVRQDKTQDILVAALGVLAGEFGG